MKKEELEELSGDFLEQAKEKYPKGTKFKTRNGQDRIASGELESIIDGLNDNLAFIGIRDRESRAFVYWHDKELWCTIIEEKQKLVKGIRDRLRKTKSNGSFDDLMKNSEAISFTAYLSIMSHYNDDTPITKVDLNYHVQEWMKIKEKKESSDLEIKDLKDNPLVNNAKDRLKSLHEELEDRISMGMGQMLDDIRYLIEKLDSDIKQRKAEKKFAARNDFDIEYRSIIKTINALNQHKNDLESLVQKYDPKKPEKEQVEYAVDWGKSRTDRSPEPWFQTLKRQIDKLSSMGISDQQWDMLNKGFEDIEKERKS